MSVSIESAAVIVWFALVAYAVFGGADFGGGVWDLLARGYRANDQHRAITEALGPVWEANNVWIIFVLVGTWTAFPIVFSSLSTALFIPLSLALLGIVLRGASFVFRSYTPSAAFTYRLWGSIFNAASIITPFLFGMCAAAIASGRIRVPDGTVHADFWTSWANPFGVVCGLFALSLCATLAATYLTVEAQDHHDNDLVELFRLRALLAGAVAAIFGGLALVLAISQAPVLWSGLVGHALVVTLGAMVIGLATAFMLLAANYRSARVLLMVEVAAVLVAWALGMAPHLIVPDVTLSNAAAPDSMLQAFDIAAGIGLILFLPSLFLLFQVFKNVRLRRGAQPSQAMVQSQEDH